MPAVYLPPNFLRKAEAARSELQSAHAQGREALFASSEGAKRPEILAARAGQQRNVEVARPECEGDGASDVEVFFYLVGRSEATEHSSHWNWTMLPLNFEAGVLLPANSGINLPEWTNRI